jgi:thymidylate kinase
MTNHSIHIDGIDGAGKTAIISALSKEFGFPIYREPGGTPVGEFLRENVLYSRAYSSTTRRMMFILSRAALNDHLLTSLDTPIALVDRSAVSSLVYELGIDMEEHIKAYRTFELTFPDIVIHVKVDPKIALQRLAVREGKGASDEQIFLESYIDQHLMPSGSTILDMLTLLSDRYDRALLLLSKYHLIKHRVVIPNNGNLDDAVRDASTFIQRLLAGNLV